MEVMEWKVDLPRHGHGACQYVHVGRGGRVRGKAGVPEQLQVLQKAPQPRGCGGAKARALHPPTSPMGSPPSENPGLRGGGAKHLWLDVMRTPDGPLQSIAAAKPRPTRALVKSSLSRAPRPTKEVDMAQGATFAQAPDKKATVALTKCANH